MSERGDVFDGARYSVAQLRAMVFDAKPGLSRPLAVMLLGRRRYASRVSDLKRLIESKSEPPRIRALAAHLLALAATPAATATLRKGLSTRDPIALRSVAHGLAWSGDLGSLAAVDRVARRG